MGARNALIPFFVNLEPLRHICMIPISDVQTLGTQIERNTEHNAIRLYHNGDTLCDHPHIIICSGGILSMKKHQLPGYFAKICFCNNSFVKHDIKHTYVFARSISPI